jgi:hypothetical protein
VKEVRASIGKIGSVSKQKITSHLPKRIPTITP